MGGSTTSCRYQWPGWAWLSTSSSHFNIERRFTPAMTYGILTFDLAWRVVATVNPAAMVSN